MKPEFDRNQLKENFKSSYSTDEDMIHFRKRMTKINKEEQDIIAVQK